MRLTMLAAMAAWLVSGVAYAQDCSDIRPKVCSLKDFEPDPTVGSGVDAKNSPTCIDPDTATDPQKNAIQAAYDLAPPRVRADLCTVAKIFVIQTGARHSWGRWENPTIHSNPPGQMQIAIHKDDMMGGKFHTKQDKHLNGLKNKTSSTTLDNFGTHPAPSNPRLDEDAFGLLYGLAHELGHIIWHRDSWRKGVGIGDDVTCSGAPNFYSWQDITLAKARRWTPFGDESDKEVHKRSVPKPSTVNNKDDLKAIYTGGFVTALAAANPEEDFVESYAMRVLIEVCPTCIFNIEIPKSSANFVIAHLG